MYVLPCSLHVTDFLLLHQQCMVFIQVSTPSFASCVDEGWTLTSWPQLPAALKQLPSLVHDVVVKVGGENGCVRASPAVQSTVSVRDLCPTDAGLVRILKALM